MLRESSEMRSVTHDRSAVAAGLYGQTWLQVSAGLLAQEEPARLRLVQVEGLLVLVREER